MDMIPAVQKMSRERIGTARPTGVVQGLLITVNQGDHLKSIGYQTPLAIVDDVTLRIPIPSADIANILDLFEDVPSPVVVGCAVTYVVAILNNFCNSHFSQNF
ncbi:hypothetical protein TNCV_1323961 [Trichonephila clavipes]|nr:hypothetical protein TNCV_1323961 [Trichonephila clavipes]